MRERRAPISEFRQIWLKIRWFGPPRAAIMRARKAALSGVKMPDRQPEASEDRH